MFLDADLMRVQSPCIIPINSTSPQPLSPAMLVRSMTTTLFSGSGEVRVMPSGYKSKKNPVLHVPDPMLVTGVLTTGDRYHSKVSDLHGFAVVQISGPN